MEATETQTDMMVMSDGSVSGAKQPIKTNAFLIFSNG